ncbi:MAG: hypothetical protein EBV03_13085 [Proteobacteria bacterium]|nr:hypothetical protein [Pseudomonadota bacterium]
MGKKGGVDFASLLKDESTVILMRGKNMFGDMIYCYLKITFGEITRLQETLENSETFDIREFGEVLAAGKGEPSSEVQAEIANAYPMLEKPKILATPKEEPVKPAEKKNWDDY